MTFFKHQHYLNKKKTKTLIGLKKKKTHVYILLLGFNIKDNGTRYYNFDIILYFELFILLLLRESHIATQI